MAEIRLVRESILVSDNNLKEKGCERLVRRRCDIKWKCTEALIKDELEEMGQTNSTSN